MSETRADIKRFLTDMVRESEHVLVDTVETAKAAVITGRLIEKLCRVYSIDEVGLYSKG